MCTAMHYAKHSQGLQIYTAFASLLAQIQMLQKKKLHLLYKVYHYLSSASGSASQLTSNW